MAGLLSPNHARGLLSLIAAGQRQPVTTADAEDERMYAANPKGTAGNQALGGSLQPQQPKMLMRAAPEAAPAPAPAPARRRPSLLESIWGMAAGYSPGVVADQYDQRERAREERDRADAMRPGILARQEAMRAEAERMGPAALIAFQTNPEKFGESLAQQYEPTTTSAGGRTDIFGTGQGVTAPTFTLNGDTMVRNDPGQGTSTPTFTREPTYAEKTARFNAENPVLAANSTWVGPDNQPRAQGYIAPNVSSVPQGGSLAVTDATGAVINTVQGNPAQVAGRNGAAFDATTRGQLATATQGANVARRRIADARRFMALNEENGTGLGAALLGPVAGLDPDYATMRAIGASLIPKEREPGSGPMSDRDVILYGKAVIDIDKPGPANRNIANAVIAQAERDIEYAAFVDEYATRNGNIVGASEDWSAYVNANPLFDEDRNGRIVVRRPNQNWRDFMGYGPRQRGGNQSRQGAPPARGPVATNPTTGARVQWNGSAWVPI